MMLQYVYIMMERERDRLHVELSVHCSSEVSCRSDILGQIETKNI